MSNDVSLIYLLVSWVFHNVHFRHFGVLKMRFLIIRRRVLLSQWFGYTCAGIRNIPQRPLLSQYKLRLLE